MERHSRERRKRNGPSPQQTVLEIGKQFECGDNGMPVTEGRFGWIVLLVLVLVFVI